MRPYSVGVFACICQGPSISLPRHQKLDVVRLFPAVLTPEIGKSGAAWMVAIFDQIARGIAVPRAEIDSQHRLDVGGLAPVDKLVGAKAIGLGRAPGEVETLRPIRHRPDAVLPIVAGDEIATGIAHDGRRQFLDQGEHVLSETLLVRLGVIGLVEAAIDAAPEMLDEGTEQARIGLTDGECAIEMDLGFKHGGGSQDWS